MALAYVTEWETGDDRSTAVYDQMNESMDLTGDPPSGMLFHAAGYVDGGVWRLFDVWETAEQYERFMNERIMPAMGRVGNSTPPDRMYSYELHNVVTT